MKVVILAGGRGLRINEESQFKPKPMVEIGGYPLLWHIIKLYSKFGFNEFIICGGYKQEIIRDYFLNFCNDDKKSLIDIQNHTISEVETKNSCHLKVTVVDTGLNTMTGGRIKRIKDLIGDDEEFMITYGDGVSDIDLNDLVKFHHEHKKDLTITAVQPEGRFGILNINNESEIIDFKEKEKDPNIWINGGFMVTTKEIFKYLTGDDCVLEKEPLVKMASERKISAYKHYGFWRCMDTLKDREDLEQLWNGGDCPWLK